jgi:hypothetical protein
MILSLWVLLLTVYLWAQPPSANKKQKAAIQRAKNLIVSSFDRSLPNVSLEFFLKYEAGGAPIKWEVNDCGEQPRNPGSDHGGESPMCVEADFDSKDCDYSPQPSARMCAGSGFRDPNCTLAQTAAVTVLVSVGTFKRGPFGAPTLFSVTITDLSGVSRPVRRLRDLPMELHRWVPRLPRDLPEPMGALPSPHHERIVLC